MKGKYVYALILPNIYIVLVGWKNVSAYMEVMINIAMLPHISSFAYIKS